MLVIDCITSLDGNSARKDRLWVIDSAVNLNQKLLYERKAVPVVIEQLPFEFMENFLVDVFKEVLGVIKDRPVCSDLIKDY